jgi:hypothetical protein
MEEDRFRPEWLNARIGVSLMADSAEGHHHRFKLLDLTCMQKRPNMTAPAGMR